MEACPSSRQEACWEEEEDEAGRQAERLGWRRQVGRQAGRLGRQAASRKEAGRRRRRQTGRQSSSEEQLQFARFRFTRFRFVRFRFRRFLLRGSGGSGSQNVGGTLRFIQFRFMRFRFTVPASIFCASRFRSLLDSKILGSMPISWA